MGEDEEKDGVGERARLGLERTHPQRPLLGLQAALLESTHDAVAEAPLGPWVEGRAMPRSTLGSRPRALARGPFRLNEIGHGLVRTSKGVSLSLVLLTW